MISARAIARVVLATFVLSLGFALTGCEDSKFMEMFDGKKKLAGDRKEVFPGGQVPGVQVGVPPELMKGYHDPSAPQSGTGADASIVPQAPGLPEAPPPSASASAEAPPAGEPPAEKKPAAKPKPKPRPKKAARPKPQPVSQAAAQPAPQATPPAPSRDAGPPPPSGGLLPWPGDASNQPPPANRFSR